MFHASLLYLPVFMGGLLVHRLSDNEQSVTVDNSDRFLDLSSSDAGLTEHSSPRNKKRAALTGAQSRAPVAYASVAPFPFLPVPIYE